jgi:hypothetical protein
MAAGSRPGHRYSPSMLSLALGLMPEMPRGAASVKDAVWSALVQSDTGTGMKAALQHEAHTQLVGKRPCSVKHLAAQDSYSIPHTTSAVVARAWQLNIANMCGA